MTKTHRPYRELSGPFLVRHTSDDLARAVRRVDRETSDTVRSAIRNAILMVERPAADYPRS